MAIFNPDQIFSNGEELASPLPKLLASLSPQSSSVLKRLTHVVRPPIDAPRLIAVVHGASLALCSYKESLISPNEDLNGIVSDVKNLADESCLLLTENGHELGDPLLRRLSRYPTWALCLTLSRNHEQETFLVATGVEIALSLTTGKPFPNGYANDLRRALEKASNQNTGISIRQHLKNEFKFKKHFESASRNAAQLFESANSSTTDDSTRTSFEVRAIRHFFRNQQYADPNHRRAMLDRHCQSRHQLLESSQNLRQRAEGGDATALLSIIAFCVGLSPELLMAMPLAGTAPADWLMTVDIDAGHIKTNIEPLFPNAASPNNSSIHRPANKILVKPLPCFVASLLNDRFRLSHTSSDYCWAAHWRCINIGKNDDYHRLHLRHRTINKTLP